MRKTLRADRYFQKISIQNSVAFLYTNNKYAEKIQATIPSTAASKEKSCSKELSNRITKEVNKLERQQQTLQ